MELFEILWDIISEILNDFIFETNNGLINVLVGTMREYARTHSLKYGRHRSLVRKIGTVLPLKPCKRTYSQILFSENRNGSKSSFELEPVDYNIESPIDFYSWSKDLKKNAPDVLSSATFSTPKEEIPGKIRTSEITAEKFAALEEQVFQLQADIAKILSAQFLPPSKGLESTTFAKDSRNDMFVEKLEGKVTSVPVQAPTTLPPPPPPLPPPPPPLPPPLFHLPPRPPSENHTSNDLISLQSKSHLNGPSHRKQITTKPPGMDEVLKSIGTVQLRRVERSPGGTPLRRPRSPPKNDLAALLNAALHRRYAQMKSDDSSPERSFINSSNHRNFPELSPKSFEEIDQFSYSISS